MSCRFSDWRELPWRWRGIEWNPRGTLRLWQFKPNREIVEYELYIEDCDGDFSLWKLSDVTHERKVVTEGEARDEDEAFSHLMTAANRQLGYPHFVYEPQ